MYVPDLDGSGMVEADTPSDINEHVTVLQGLQQFRDVNLSACAATLGMRGIPTMPIGWITKVGDLGHEKIAVKKELGPAFRVPVPDLGIHGTRAVILPPLPGSKENCFVSIDNVKLHHVANPT
ncbi:hypothetical protein NDU88_004836 [Pleurodeles waltl]|uniref:Uncharacterized protein n=1 Tax=Pleurodeles waltl TaxID=8319 RepID=A0AAV7SK29_PLEWA|nr:hypothetical protein NDU88_004836 [Pleurodeles waltl]